MAAAGSNGIVRFYNNETLEYKGLLPKVKPQSAAAPSSSTAASPMVHGDTVGAFPSALSCQFDRSGQYLAVAYLDRSLLVWDVSDLDKVSGQLHNGNMQIFNGKQSELVTRFWYDRLCMASETYIAYHLLTA